VCSLFRAYYGVANDVTPLVALVPGDGRQTTSACVVAPEGQIHKVSLSSHDPDPLEALRDDLIVRLARRIRSDVEVLFPFIGSVPALAPLVRLALVLQFSKAYIALRQACAPGSGVGGERGRAAHHAYEHAAAALMAHVAKHGG
jgi:hypothetical protein